MKNFDFNETYFLIDLVGEINSEKILSRRLYRYAERLYLIRLMNDEIKVFLWADSDEAARRVIGMEVESYHGPAKNTPLEYFPYLDINNYNDIIEKMKNKKKSYNESAVYRIAVDGAFSYKKIDTQEYSFYFLDIKKNLKEAPFAVLFKSLEKLPELLSDFN